MAEERKFCGNCGTPLVVQDGKIMCPNCGTEYAVDWGQEDVARAQAETAQARTQAQQERDRVISRTREEITKQQTYDTQRRERQRSKQGAVNWLIRIGIILALFYMSMFMFRACGLLLSRNSGSISKTLFGEDAGTQQTSETLPVKIDEDLLHENKDFLKAIYESQVYVIDNLTSREIIPEGSDMKLVYTGNFEYVESHLVYTNNGRTELFSFFAMEYAPEDGGDSVTMYIPVYVAMTGVRYDGKIRSDLEGHQYKGSLGQNGFEDKDVILKVYSEAWDNVDEIVPFEMPESIRAEVTGN